MRKWLILTLVLVLGVSTLKGQRYGIELGAGLQSARMDDMKYLQDLILEAYPVPGKHISSFPPYVTATFGFRRQLFPAAELGVAYANSNTGARTNYSDYSGSISTDFKVRSNRLGAMVSYRLVGETLAVLNAYGKAEVNYTTMSISTLYVINNSFSDRDYYEYRSLSPSISGGLEFFFQLESASLGLDASYMADIPGKFKEKDSGNELLDPNDRDRALTSDWTGWRIQVKVVIWL